jgi:hypothetical protein
VKGIKPFIFDLTFVRVSNQPFRSNVIASLSSIWTDIQTFEFWKHGRRDIWSDINMDDILTLHLFLVGPLWSWSHGSWIYNYLCNQCLSPLMLWVQISIRASCTTLCDKVCQWLATGRWFSPGPPVSSTNKADCHDITEIFWKWR